MSRFIRKSLSLLLCGLPAAGMAQPAITPAPAFTAEDLLAYPRDGWVTNGGNVYNQRYSPLDQINRDNVAQLKAEWRTHLNSALGPQYSGQAQSLVYEGVLYIITGANDVFALDVETGGILWEYRANLDPSRVNVCCGWTNRGVAMGDGKIFFGRLDAKFIALDQRTGEVVWEIQAEDPAQGFSITSPPLYYEGMIISGFAGSNQGIRGRLRAYDADTGEEMWTFYTIPAPGEFGSDTWPADSEIWRYGGGSVWQTPAADPELGLLYFSTGNAWPEFNGAIRAGDNLFTSSIVAIDAATGEYRWHYQQTHHDIWDYDSPNPVILFDAEIDGEMRRGIAQIPKSGYLYILDRVTGEPIFPIEETPVPQEPGRATSPTQPIPVGEHILPHTIDVEPEGGWKLVNEGRTFTPLGMNGATVIYRPLAHVNWPPSAYDPESHLMYICATDQIGALQADPEGHPGTPRGDIPFMETDGFANAGIPRRGIYTAVDLSTREVVWQKQYADRCFSGSAVTAGGLVFHGRNDGRLTAMDSANGDLLWQFQTGTGAGIHGAPTVFEHEGVQYVAAFAGGSIFAPGEAGDSVWLFSLRGELEPSDVARPATTGAPQARVDITQTITLPPGEPDLQAGAQLYRQVCLPCHGENGRGGEGGGAPLTSALALNDVVSVVSFGRNNMPPFGTVITPQQLRDVSHYVLEEVVE